MKGQELEWRLVSRELGVQLTILILFAVTVYALPPSFANHQFYGTVQWDAGAVAPTKVSAVIGLVLTESVIKSSGCTAVVCTGTYGKDADNILRITGEKNGDVILFKVGNTNLLNYTYQAGSVTELNLSVVTVGDASAADSSETSSGSDASDISDAGNIIDVGVNDTEDYAENATEEGFGGIETEGIENTTALGTATSSELESCTQVWSCSSWSVCKNNVQSRSCSRADDCDAQLEAGLIGTIIEVPKLPEMQGCVSPSSSSSSSSLKPAPAPGAASSKTDKPAASCADGIKNQGEIEVDCGGECDACPGAGSNWGYYLGGGAMLIIVIVLFLFFLRRGPKLDEQTANSLRSAYAGGRYRGMSEDQITNKLKESGWDERILKTFLRKK